MAAALVHVSSCAYAPPGSTVCTCDPGRAREHVLVGGHSPSLLMCLTLAPDLLSGRKSYTGNWLVVKSELRCTTALGIVATVKVKARGAPGYCVGISVRPVHLECMIANSTTDDEF